MTQIFSFEQVNNLYELKNPKELTSHPFTTELYGEVNDESSFSQLLNSIRTYGILEPILVANNLIILDGRKRVAIANSLGMHYVPVRKLPDISEKAQMELIITLNQNKAKPSSVRVKEALALEEMGFILDSLGNTSKKAQANTFLAKRCGFSNSRVFEQAKQIVASGDKALIKLMDENSITTAYRKLHRQKKGLSIYSPVIKPSDNWNFSTVFYPRIDENKEHGYIPGDLYANCFWYFTKPGDIVVDPMAGSGMAQYMYGYRKEWMGDHIYDFDLQLFDLTPQNSTVIKHNLLEGFPILHADYIFMDIPYFGMVKNVYSRKKEDIANMDKEEYLYSIELTAKLCSTAQSSKGLCTIVSPNYVDHQNQEILNLPNFIRHYWQRNGYRLYIETYSSRRIQQTQNATMAKLNNLAKKQRLPLTDIALIMTFQKI